MTFKVILFRKKKTEVLLKFALFFIFVYLLPSLIIERTHTTSSVFAKGAIERILRAKKYGFTTSTAFSGN